VGLGLVPIGGAGVVIRPSVGIGKYIFQYMSKEKVELYATILSSDLKRVFDESLLRKMAEERVGV